MAISRSGRRLPATARTRRRRMSIMGAMAESVSVRRNATKSRTLPPSSSLAPLVGALTEVSVAVVVVAAAVAAEVVVTIAAAVAAAVAVMATRTVLRSMSTTSRLSLPSSRPLELIPSLGH
eukprot:Rmarinus@m.4851